MTKLTFLAVKEIAIPNGDSYKHYFLPMYLSPYKSFPTLFRNPKTGEIEMIPYNGGDKEKTYWETVEIAGTWLGTAGHRYGYATEKEFEEELLRRVNPDWMQK